MIETTPVLIAFAVSLAINITLALALYRATRNPFRAAACRRCGYDVRTTLSGRCPECGEPVPDRHEFTRAVTQCSFCGKSNRETGPQVEGPNAAYICAPCVELSHTVILKNRSGSSAS